MDILSDIQYTPPIAKKRNRIAAAVIDMLILGIISMIYFTLFGHVTTEGGENSYDLDGFPALFYYAICFCLIPLQEGLTGMTIGKRVVKLKVVKTDYSKTSVWLCIVRHFFDVFDYFMLIGLIVAYSNERNRRIGDLVAGTMVVAEGSSLLI